jgi:hypothetical protein
MDIQRHGPVSGGEFSPFMQDLRFFHGITITDQKCEPATNNYEAAGFFNNYRFVPPNPLLINNPWF